MMIKLRHIREAEICTRGARLWFNSHGLSWNNFLTKGIEVEVIEKFDDALANRVIEVARKEKPDGR
jgi:hypothetical protein